MINPDVFASIAPVPYLNKLGTAVCYLITIDLQRVLRMRRAVLAWLPSLVCGMMIEMVPFEDGSLDQEQFEAKYADVSYPVRAQHERIRQ